MFILNYGYIWYDRLYQGHNLLRDNSCFSRNKGELLYLQVLITLARKVLQKHTKFDFFQYSMSFMYFMSFISLGCFNFKKIS